MFSYVFVGERVPADHPIRKLCVLADAILKEFGDLLASRYAAGGRVNSPWITRYGNCAVYVDGCVAGLAMVVGRGATTRIAVP